MLYNTVAFGNMGIAIIELTIIIRLILLPSSIKALRAQIALQRLQPELEKINKKYKGDKQKQSQATMEFYQKNKVNPLSSCLPTLLQLPILIALFWILRDALNSNNLHLLYPLVKNPGQINVYFLHINLAQKGNYVLAAIAAVTQYIQAKMIMPPKKAGEAGMQSMLSNQLVYIMPVITFIFAIQFPAGLALYWVTTTVFAIVTQYYILKEGKGDKENKGKEITVNPEGTFSKFLKKYTQGKENDQNK
jgi:YidC/Oxa1 family membrane protein insertase